MEGIINPIVDLLKIYAFQGGIAGIVVGAFLFLGLVYLYKNPSSGSGPDGNFRLFLILFFVLGVLALFSGIYGITNWKTISGSRLADKPWAVQLETDDTFEDAAKNEKRFEQLFKDLVIVATRETGSGKPRFYLFNLYSNELDADSGTETAHREWQRLKYPEEYKDSASTKDLKQLCKTFDAAEDGSYFRCNNE